MSHDLEQSFPTLKNAPITEAVIDIQAIVPQDVSLDDLARFQDGHAGRFDKRSERKSLEARVEFQKDAPARFISRDQSVDGYLFHSSSEFLIAQARTDGFTLSRLKPYHDGQTFAQQARDLWQRYVEVARPTKVTRIALRNINRIEVVPGVDLQQYVLTGPEISRALPQRMDGFFLRIVMPDESGAIAIVTQTFAAPEPGSQMLPLIFDIDSFRLVELEPSDPKIWDIVGELRRFKNAIFFKSITSTTLEAYR